MRRSRECHALCVLIPVTGLQFPQEMSKPARGLGGAPAAESVHKVIVVTRARRAFAEGYLKTAVRPLV